MFGTSSGLTAVDEFAAYMDEYHDATQTGKPDNAPANSIRMPVLKILAHLANLDAFLVCSRPGLCV